MTPIDTFSPAPGYIARVYPDHDHGNPWDEECGHISPEYFDRRADVPSGWTVMSTHGRGYWAFDLGAALMKAAREKWGLDPSSREYRAIQLKPGHAKPTRSQIRYAAVKADASRMADYINGGWHYVGISVTGEGEEETYEHAVWGIESDCEGAKRAMQITLNVWGIESDCEDWHYEIAKGLAVCAQTKY